MVFYKLTDYVYLLKKMELCWAQEHLEWLHGDLWKLIRLRILWL